MNYVQWIGKGRPIEGSGCDSMKGTILTHTNQECQAVNSRNFVHTLLCASEVNIKLKTTLTYFHGQR